MLRAIAHYGQTNASIGQRARGEDRAVRLDAPELARGQTGDTPEGGDEGARRAVAAGLGDLLEGDLTGEQLDCMLRSSSGDPGAVGHAGLRLEATGDGARGDAQAVRPLRQGGAVGRSEERRVGKGGRWRWGRDYGKGSG